jgi:hypothetical protein
MQVQRAIEIATREWANIRVSLEEYGDIGEFDSKSHVNNRLTLVDIGNKFLTHEHLTKDSSLIRKRSSSI